MPSSWETIDTAGGGDWSNAQKSQVTYTTCFGDSNFGVLPLASVLTIQIEPPVVPWAPVTNVDAPGWTDVPTT